MTNLDRHQRAELLAGRTQLTHLYRVVRDDGTALWDWYEPEDGGDLSASALAQLHNDAVMWCLRMNNGRAA